MKTFKKLSAIFLSIFMVCFIAFPTNALASTTSEKIPVAHDVYYTVYNEYGEIVEEGLIPATSDARYSWSGSITLDNGWYTSFKKPGAEAFYTGSGTTLSFSYTLDRSAKIEYNFYQDNVSSTTYPTVWKTGTKTASRATLTQVTNKTGYYFVGITNASSDPITISDVSFVF